MVTRLNEPGVQEVPKGKSKREVAQGLLKRRVSFEADIVAAYCPKKGCSFVRATTYWACLSGERERAIENLKEAHAVVYNCCEQLVFLDRNSN